MAIFSKFFKKRIDSPSQGIVDTKTYRTKNDLNLNNVQTHLVSSREELYQMIAENDSVDSGKS